MCVCSRPVSVSLHVCERELRCGHIPRPGVHMRPPGAVMGPHPRVSGHSRPAPAPTTRVPGAQVSSLMVLGGIS